MSPIQVHLALNHIPILLVPVGILLLVAALIVKSVPLRMAGLVLILGAAIVAIPVYYSGGDAEHPVEEIEGVSRHAVHEHEEAAQYSFAALLGAGALALLALALGRRVTRRWPIWLVLVAGSFAAATTFRVAHLGGLIRHPELNGTTTAGESASPPE